MEWTEQGMRLSPFDSWAEAAFDAQAMSHLLRGRYEESCLAAYKSVQANPAHSITYVRLAAALARLGRLDEARAAAARVLELHPAFRYSRQFAGVNYAPALAGGSWRRAAGRRIARVARRTAGTCLVWPAMRRCPLNLVRPLRAVSAIWR
jgi:tetratricopeptide (TPR) repeat protein